MKIIGIGKPCVDYISVVEKLPKPDSGAGILDFSMQGGGNTATAVAAAARLGVPSGFIGLTGSCRNGGFIRDDFIYNNVDISNIITVNGGVSDFAVILSDLETKGRSILYKSGNLRGLEKADLNREYIQGADFLHLEGCGETERAAAAWVREKGGKTAIDAARYYRELEEFIPFIDIFIASEYYYKAKFGADGDYEKNCRTVAGMGPEIVVFTLGERGCAGFCEAEGFFSDAGFCADVVDTVGAGDVFHGAFLAGLARGMSVRETARFANAVSACKIGSIGGRSGIPSFEGAMRFIRTGETYREETERRVEHYRNMWLYR
jgi:sugar/nucleoside kinase (ribokinase family)